MAAIALDSIALALTALTLAAPPLHVDADGDGFADSVVLSHGSLVVAARTGVLSARVPAGAQLDGALHLRGLRGVLLLVRFGSPMPRRARS